MTEAVEVQRKLEAQGNKFKAPETILGELLIPWPEEPIAILGDKTNEQNNKRNDTPS